jgi:hypothetical protein
MPARRLADLRYGGKMEPVPSMIRKKRVARLFEKMMRVARHGAP